MHYPLPGVGGGAPATPPAQAFVVAPHAVSSGRPAYQSPARHRPAGRDQRSPDIFGTVALPAGETPSTAAWRRVVAASLPATGPWADLLFQARAQPPANQLQLVNSWVNRAIVFTEDARLYAKADYWATAEQSLRGHRGDCEDYAIAKMQLLLALGVPVDHLYLVIARDVVRRADHALLAVRLDGEFWILDSAANPVLLADQVRDYRPIITYGDNRTWVHGYRRAPATRIAEAASSPRALRVIGR